MKTISMSTCIAQFRTPCRQPMLIALGEDDGEREGERGGNCEERAARGTVGKESR